MSLLLSRESSTESEVGGGGLTAPHLSDFSVNYNNNNNNNSSFSQDEGSFDGDRPHSRLTIIESPTTSYDHDEDFSHFSLDSPDQEDDYYETSPRHPNNLKPGGSHACDECFKTFSSPGKLKQHEYTHTGETPFECKIPGCDKKFTSKFKLKRHILIHSQTKTFLCDICQRAFRRKDHLKNHEKVHDPGKTVYTCSYDGCGRTYNSISSFRKHQAMHSAEEGQLDCKICKMMLQSQDELMNHLKVHAGSRTIKGSVDKKFVCNQCEKKFFTRKDLKRHSVVHTGNREFSCPHCTQRFGRKDHMTRHAKKTHASFYEASRAGHERTRLISTPVPDQNSDHELPRSTRKERSISDPGPIPVSPSINPSDQKLIEESTGVKSAQVTHEFQKLVTQDNFDKNKTQPLAIQRQVIVRPSSTNDSFNRTPMAAKRNNENSDSYKQNFLHIRTPNITTQNTSLKPQSIHAKSREIPIIFPNNIPQNGLTYNQSGTANFYSRESRNQNTSQEHIISGHNLNYEQENLAQKENFQLNDMQTRRERHVSKVQESPPANEFHKLMTLNRDSVTIKEEEPCHELYDEDLPEENAIKELLAEKDRIDLTSFMTEFNDDLPQNIPGKRIVYLNPPSPPMDEDSLLPKYLEENLIKLEPNSRPSSPMDSTLIQENFNATNQQYPSFDQDPSSQSFPHLIPIQPLQPKPRTIFIRTQSQDSLTKTKNPVLPSIHAESSLVVPEPNQIKYPTTQNHLFLGFSDEKDEQLTELRGSLFLSEEYGQSYFQPWN
eukprot:GFUD01033736.1.p1 GENE.GFUD01033736.1~~GFUD01033736.1.p1  ORF type:complete len:774 (-),score=112.56 GFUD01033736.1:2240-4561(-)